MSNTILRMGVPIATSTRPVRATLPDRAKTLVPLLVFVPRALNRSAPIESTVGRFARVSTLLMIVGLPNRPLTAGKGGRGRGMPRRPSMLWIRAVSSPQTNAPAPILMTTCKGKSVPRMLSPSRCSASACAMAAFSRLTAKGYSARI